MSPRTIPNSQQILLLWKNTARLDPIINLHSPIVNNCRCPIINVLSPVINLLKYQIHNKFCWRATAKLDPIINQHSPIIICRCPIINVRSPIINLQELTIFRRFYLFVEGLTGRLLGNCDGADCHFSPAPDSDANLGLAKQAGWSMRFHFPRLERLRVATSLASSIRQIIAGLFVPLYYSSFAIPPSASLDHPERRISFSQSPKNWPLANCLYREGDARRHLSRSGRNIFPLLPYCKYFMNL